MHRKLSMLRYRLFVIALAFTSQGLARFADQACFADESLPQRMVPWTNSNVKGTPDPPLPYKALRVFANVELQNPTDVVWLPEADRWIATQQNGKLIAFGDDSQSATTEIIADLSDCHEGRINRALATLFHHDLEHHPWCFVTYSYRGEDEEGTMLVRFRVTDPSIPTLDLESRTVLTSWTPIGHSGGSMQFGPDGMLYVSVGDGQSPYPPDGDETGQDLSDLEASILRIDVDHPGEERPYRIPDDNPFVGKDDARGEVWSFGLRNPWKIAFNPENGDLLAADVGWEMREMIYRVDRGRNHGWSIMEGSQTVKENRQPEIPITPPLFEHTHLDSRSITGGHFWQSDRIPELKGAYIYGDWMTGKVWALRSEGDTVLWQKELVDTSLQIVCFGLDSDGEVLMVGYDGTIMILEPNDQTQQQTRFPKRLSETGVFTDVIEQIPSEGVIEYEINAHHWADGTRSRQWIGIPEKEQLGLYERDDWQRQKVAGRFEFPTDTVLAKTVSYLTDPNDPSSIRHLETQLLHLPGDDWRAYNYIWNESQTDAILQDDIATDRQLIIKDKTATDGKRTQTWRHASRSECLLCHVWAGGTVHGFWPPQLNRSTGSQNQLARLTKMGLFQAPVPTVKPMVSPHDPAQPLEARARSYLSLNCSTCHRTQGGGTANFNFDLNKSLKQNNYIDEVPSQGDFGINGARVIAPGDPYRSVLLFRILKSGRGHMPQFGSNVIDLGGAKLIHDWIRSMSAESLDVDDMKVTDAELENWFQSPRHTLALSFTCACGELEDRLRDGIIQKALAHDNPLVRDLFEHYLPEEQRTERLGPDVDASMILALKGSADRGRQLFESAKDINCRACHRIAGVGQNVGPDLTGIASKQSPAEILASILSPSQKIDPKYRSRQILTGDGKILVGLVAMENAQQITLVDSAGKTHNIDADEIDAMQAAEKSIMPDQLLSGMTADQVADLMAYLVSTK